MATIRPIIAVAEPLARLGCALAFVLAAGCSGPRFDWVGTWRGERPMPEAVMQNPTIAATLARVELTIHENGRFDLFEAGLPKDGKIRYEDGKGFLKIERFLQRPISEQGSAATQMNEEIRLEPQPDGSVLLIDPRGFDPEPIRLTRYAQPEGNASRMP